MNRLVIGGLTGLVLACLCAVGVLQWQVMGLRAERAEPLPRSVTSPALLAEVPSAPRHGTEVADGVRPSGPSPLEDSGLEAAVASESSRHVEQRRATDAGEESEGAERARPAGGPAGGGSPGAGPDVGAATAAKRARRAQQAREMAANEEAGLEGWLATFQVEDNQRGAVETVFRARYNSDMLRIASVYDRGRSALTLRKKLWGEVCGELAGTLRPQQLDAANCP